MADKAHWMEDAFSKNKGSFRAAAKKHGLSTKSYAKKEKDAGGKLGKRANLALIGMKFGGNHIT